MSALSIGLLQGELRWHQPAANRDHYGRLIEQSERCDLYVLPEMFTTGFTMRPAEVAEAMSGDTVTWMQALAAETGAALCGSVVIAEGEQFYNRFLFVTADGVQAQYDKRHLFTLAGEDRPYTAGQSRVVFDYRGWRICPQVCYDLRFPVFSRNRGDYDVLIYVANWPQPRQHAWDTLLQARAIENQAYCIGVNRIGQDDNGLKYQGGSAAIDYLGQPIYHAGDLPGVGRCELSLQELQQHRRQLAFLEDSDPFELI